MLLHNPIQEDNLAQRICTNTNSGSYPGAFQRDFWGALQKSTHSLLKVLVDCENFSAHNMYIYWYIYLQLNMYFFFMKIFSLMSRMKMCRNQHQPHKRLRSHTNSCTILELIIGLLFNKTKTTTPATNTTKIGWNFKVHCSSGVLHAHAICRQQHFRIPLNIISTAYTSFLQDCHLTYFILV